MAKQAQQQKEKSKQEQATETKAEVKISQSELKERAQKCVKGIKEAIDRVEEGYFDCAELLYEASVGKYWIPLGYNEWDYFVADKFGLKPRKADYYVGIQKAINECGLTRKQLQGIGWSKMAIMYKVLSKENAKEWLKRAKETSFRDMVVIVKLYKQKQKAGDGEEVTTEPPVIAKLTFSLAEDKMSFVSNALQAATELLGTDNKGAAIAHICTEWMEARGVDVTALDFDSWVSFLEEKYPVKINYEVIEEEEEEEITDEDENEDVVSLADEDEDESEEESEEEESEESEDENDEESEEAEEDESEDDLSDLLGEDSEEEEEEEEEEEPVKPKKTEKAKSEKKPKTEKKPKKKK